MQKGQAQAKLAIADQDTPSIHIYDTRGGSSEPLDSVQLHRAPVLAMRYNAPYDTVISVDTKGRQPIDWPLLPHSNSAATVCCYLMLLTLFPTVASPLVCYELSDFGRLRGHVGGTASKYLWPVPPAVTKFVNSWAQSHDRQLNQPSCQYTTIEHHILILSLLTLQGLRCLCMQITSGYCYCLPTQQYLEEGSAVQHSVGHVLLRCDRVLVGL